MSVACWRISQEGCLVESNPEDGLLHHAATSPRWLDIEGENADAIGEILKHLSVNADVVEECVSSGRQRMAVFERVVFLSFPVVVKDEMHPEYLRILSLPNFIVTIHEHHVPGLAKVQADFAHDAQLHACTTAALAHAILEAIFDMHVLLGLAARDRVNELATRMDEHADAVDIGELLALKHEIGRLEMAFEDQLYCVAALLQVKAAGLELGEQRKDFQDFEHEVETALRLGNRLERRLQDLHQYFVTCLQEKTNKRLNILTMIQSVFVPMTVIAGIYGMNFEVMPELDWRYGYPVVLLVMALIAVVELYLFHRFGWFDFLQRPSTKNN